MCEQSVPLTPKDTLQKKGLTSRYLPRLVDLFVSAPGLASHLFVITESLGKLGGLCRSLLLQCFTFADGILQLLLDFGHPSFMLAAGNLFGR